MTPSTSEPSGEDSESLPWCDETSTGAPCPTCTTDVTVLSGDATATGTRTDDTLPPSESKQATGQDKSTITESDIKTVTICPTCSGDQDTSNEGPAPSKATTPAETEEAKPSDTKATTPAETGEATKPSKENTLPHSQATATTTVVDCPPGSTTLVPCGETTATVTTLTTLTCVVPVSTLIQSIPDTEAPAPTKSKETSGGEGPGGSKGTNPSDHGGHSATVTTTTTVDCPPGSTTLVPCGETTVTVTGATTLTCVGPVSTLVSDVPDTTPSGGAQVPSGGAETSPISAAAETPGESGESPAGSQPTGSSPEKPSGAETTAGAGPNPSEAPKGSSSGVPQANSARTLKLGGAMLLAVAAPILL